MKYGKIFLFLGLILLLASPFFVLPRVVKIGRIDCQSQFGPCSRTLKEKIESLSQEKKTFLETKKELTAVLGEEIIVDDFSLQFKLPDKLKIDVLERKPRFAVQNQTGAIALIDGEGYSIAVEDSTALPRLIIADALPNVGERVTEKTLFALELLEDLFSLYQVETGRMGADSLVIELSGGPRVIFPLEGNRQALIGSLRIILAKLNSESGVSTIDLRFRNPVIK